MEVWPEVVVHDFFVLHKIGVWNTVAFGGVIEFSNVIHEVSNCQEVREIRGVGHSLGRGDVTGKLHEIVSVHGSGAVAIPVHLQGRRIVERTECERHFLAVLGGVLLGVVNHG